MKLALTILFLTIIAIGKIDASVMPRTKVKITQNTVSSLIEGLNSENLGLKSSSAYMIGELQLSKAVIPLMKILRDLEAEGRAIVTNAGVAAEDIRVARSVDMRYLRQGYEIRVALDGGEVGRQRGGFDGGHSGRCQVSEDFTPRAPPGNGKSLGFG